MSLFGGKRDVSLFRSINREIINKIINTEVDVYKISLSDTHSNLYGESANKTFYTPVRINCLIEYPDTETTYETDGIPNITRNPAFRFLRDDLVIANLILEIGDIIEYDNAFWEINKVDDKDAQLNRDPKTNKASGDFGWVPGVLAYTHMISPTKVNVDNNRSGRSDSNKNLYG